MFGYLYHLDDSVRDQLRSPSNYGRYVNAYILRMCLWVSTSNCVFVGDDTGLSVVWVVALVDVVAGTELLVNYDPAYRRYKRALSRSLINKVLSFVGLCLRLLS